MYFKIRRLSFRAETTNNSLISVSQNLTRLGQLPINHTFQVIPPAFKNDWEIVLAATPMVDFCLVAMKAIAADPSLSWNFCLTFCLDIWKGEIFGDVAR